MNPDNPYNREALVSGLAAPIEDWLSKFDREGLEGFLQYILQGWDIDEKHWTSLIQFAITKMENETKEA
mgnify:FL=1